MASASSASPFVAELLQALGLKDAGVTKLVLNIERNDVVRVEVQMLNLGDAPQVIKHYAFKAVPIEFDDGGSQ
jgi:hypothetical protein